MKKYFSLALVLFFCSVFSQVGVNTATPTEDLDVNGKVRIRNTEVLTSNSVSVINVDENGVVGISYVGSNSPLTTFVNGTSATNVLTDFNAGNIIVLPISATSIGLNSLNATLENNRLRIPESGTYQLSASLNIFLSTGVIRSTVFLAFNVQLSKDNGGTWEAISGARPIFTMSGRGNFYYNSTLPTGLVNLVEGDLLRLVIYRTRGMDNTLQGANLTTGSVQNASQHGTKAYTLSLSKF